MSEKKLLPDVTRRDVLKGIGKGAALTQGIARGVQVGSLAGGAKQIFGKGSYGKTRGRPPKKKGVKKIKMNKIGKGKK